MSEMKWNDRTGEALSILSKGAFLTVSDSEKTNTMTIGWGDIGYIWRKPVFTVLVRPSRYTSAILETSGEFTVSIPTGNMQQALGICGTKSGRDLDKFAAAGLKTLPGQVLKTPVIDCAGIHYECRVLYKQAMNPAHLDPAIAADCYATGDYHVIYYGEIVAVYEK